MAGSKDTSGVQRLTTDWIHSTKWSQHSRIIPDGSLCVKAIFTCYAVHPDTEKVFLCATSCSSSLPSQCMFYFNFLRVFQKTVMSCMIFVNWQCKISMLLCQLWKFAALFNIQDTTLFGYEWKNLC